MKQTANSETVQIGGWGGGGGGGNRKPGDRIKGVENWVMPQTQLPTPLYFRFVEL